MPSAKNRWGEPTLSVQELIDALLNVPEKQRHLPVETEGCDCDGTVGMVDFDEEDERIYLNRAHE